MSLLFWTDLKHTQTNMKIYRTFWNHTPAPPRQPDFLSNNGFSYVNILYVGTEYEKERNFREKRKEEESSLVGRCILTRQILKVCQKGMNLRIDFWPIDFRLW
jgi:hypothetical protein